MEKKSLKTSLFSQILESVGAFSKKIVITPEKINKYKCITLLDFTTLLTPKPTLNNGLFIEKS